MSYVEPEICNCAALRQAARHVTKLYDGTLAPSGLGVNQFSILARLDLVGPSTIQDLAQLLVMDRSTLGHLLRPLEKRGLVTLEVCDQDRRSRTIVLTDVGKAAVAKAPPRSAVLKAHSVRRPRSNFARSSKRLRRRNSASSSRQHQCDRDRVPAYIEANSPAM
jgi:DNA-binding MarR family transcriptional regulator